MSKFVYEDISEVIFHDSVNKHGSHNQKTHGGKGGGGGKEKQGKTFATLNDFMFSMASLGDEDIDGSLDILSTSQSPEYGQDAVFQYVNNSNPLNMALRADPEFAKEEFGPLIKDLDETMSRTPNITESITVYRGLSGGDDLPEGFDTLEAGDIFSDSAFMSTTLAPQIALEFATRRTDGIIMEISVPANSEGIFPNSWLSNETNSFFGEFEFLLPRDSQLKVISTEGKVWRMEVTRGQK